MAKTKDYFAENGYIKRIISKHIRYIKPAKVASEQDKQADIYIESHEETWNLEKKEWIKK